MADEVYEGAIGIDLGTLLSHHGEAENAGG
jgi:hypothetical protein